MQTPIEDETTLFEKIAEINNLSHAKDALEKKEGAIISESAPTLEAITLFTEGFGLLTKLLDVLQHNGAEIGDSPIQVYESAHNTNFAITIHRVDQITRIDIYYGESSQSSFTKDGDNWISVDIEGRHTFRSLLFSMLINKEIQYPDLLIQSPEALASRLLEHLGDKTLTVILERKRQDVVSVVFQLMINSGIQSVEALLQLAQQNGVEPKLIQSVKAVLVGTSEPNPTTE